MSRQLLALALFGLVSMLILHFDLLPSKQSSRELSQTQQQSKPILYIHDLERRHFDNEGQASSQIFTDKAKQFEHDQEHLYLENALFYFGGKGEQQWQGKAKKGKIHIDSEISYLSDNVFFQQLDSATVITTATLTIDNISKIASSSDLVTLYDDYTKTTAIGMEADLAQQSIWLKSHVHSVRQPMSATQPAD